MPLEKQDISGEAVFKIIVFLFTISIVPRLFPQHAKTAWSLSLVAGTAMTICLPPILSWKRNLWIFGGAVFAAVFSYWFLQ